MGDTHAIRTSYGLISFRSRLEATWACFFDQCGWKWEYEPVDLPGWIPDFTLDTSRGRLFVEVKPLFLEDYAVTFTDAPQEFLERQFFDYIVPDVPRLKAFSDLRKVFESRENWLIVGAAPVFGGTVFAGVDSGTFLGIHNQICDWPGIPTNGIVYCAHELIPNGHICYNPFFLFDYGPDGSPDNYWFPYKPVDFYRAAWARAKNTTQWRAT